MASKMEFSFILPTILLCAMISCCVAQTFQYSRGWVNGKRSVPLASTPKASERPVVNEEMPDICKQFFLSDLLARSNTIAIHVIAHDYPVNAQQVHSAAFYQRPQIKHDADLVASVPYGYVETPALQNVFDASGRYKRNAKNTI